MIGQIYILTCLPTGKRYVGQTKQSLEVRLKEHLRHATQNRKNKCTHLAHAIQKYGKHSFTIQNVAIADTQEELNELEMEYICRYGDLNISIGGQSPANTPEIAQKISNSMKKVWQDTSHRQKISEANKIPFQDPEYVRLKSNLAKRKWEDPIYKAEMIEKFKKAGKVDTPAKQAQLKAMSKPVIGTCIKTGQEVAFDSLSEALRNGYSNVHAAINGKQKTAGGCTWRYA